MSGDGWVTVQPQSDGWVTLPPHAHPKPHAQSRSLASLKAIATGAPSTTSPLGIIDLLNRPHEALTAGLTSGNVGTALRTLLHGQSPASQDQTRAELRKAMGEEGDEPAPWARILGRHAMAPGSRYSDEPHWAQGVEDFTTDMTFDPMTYFGGAGIGRKVLGEAALRSLPAAQRAGAAISRAATHLPAPAANAVEDALRHAAWLHARMVPGGELKQALAKKLSPEAAATAFAHVSAAKGAAQHAVGELTHAFTQRLHSIVQGLEPEQERAIYVAVNSGREFALPKALRDRAAQFGELTDTVAHLMGTRNLQAQLASYGFRLPEWAEPLQKYAQPIMNVSQYRKAYVPLGHQEMVDSEKAAQWENYVSPKLTRAQQTTTRDPFLKPRTDDGLVAPTAEAARQTIEQRLRAAAQSLAGRASAKRVAPEVGARGPGQLPREIEDFLHANERVEAGSFLNGLRNVVDLPKNALFYLPFRHMGNITALQALHYPQALPKTVSNFTKLLLDPGARGQVLGDAEHMGLAMAQGADRSNRFADLASHVPVVGKAASGLYKWSNKVLWNYDDAAKAAALEAEARRFLAAGMSRKDALARASKEVGDRLVNYGQRSALTDAAGYIAPFATWRTKLPGAVARGVAEHPERVLAAQRAAPTLVGGSQQTGMTDEQGDALGSKSYNPLSDILDAVPYLGASGGPQRYLRGSLSFPYQALGSAGMAALEAAASQKRKPSHWLSYGHDPAVWALEGMGGPFADPFGEGILDRLLYGTTGLTATRNQ